MFRDLDHGKLPDKNRLRGWFRAALTKKLAVISLPPAFWVNDSKRNPDAHHLLWASVLLQDLEGFRTVQTIMATEHNELHLEQSVDDWIADGLDDLLQMVSGSEIQDEIKSDIQFLTQ